MSNELVQAPKYAEIVSSPSALEVERQRFLPVMNIAMAVERRATMVEAVQKLMRPDHDYGKIPGVKKDVLLQPGAQKLDNLFGFVPRFEIASSIEDWTGKDHGDEPFFQYNVKCQLWRGDFLMGEAIGSCSSWESKYRYRSGDRVCPACQKPGAIIKGKEEYGGGWLCFPKKGGCNAKFKDGDQSIEGQATGKVKNPDIYDQVNTILKMAEKRAHVAATINATSASEFFTQDMEDASGGPPEPPPDPRGSQKAANAVAEQKLDAMRNGRGFVETPKPQPAPVSEWETDIAQKLYRSLDKYGKLKAFGEVKARISRATGSDAQYYSTLKDHGVAHANEFKLVKTSWACYEELVDLAEGIEASLAPPPMDYQADDSDVPPELRG